MAGRRSVWSDPRIIDISKQFIPTTDEVWRLQGVKDNDATLFQEMANKGHYRRVGGSRQGIYVCSPGGKLLASINSLNPDDVLKMIDDGLDKWNDLPLSERQLPENYKPQTVHRWEDSYPVKGLVLKSAKADVFTDPPVQSERGDRWNMDHVWFSKDEARLWLPKDPKEGDTYQLPTILKDRLFRFHMVDNVRGQTLPFAPQEIKEAHVQVKVIKQNKSNIQINISGHSWAVAKGPWLLGENDWTPTHELDHGIQTNLLGDATYNLELETFTDFEMVALGKWHGKTQNNGRHSGPRTGRIGTLYSLATDSPADRIARAFVDLYNADWIIQP